MRCRICAVDIAQNKAKRWVHLDTLPKGTKEHDADPFQDEAQAPPGDAVAATPFGVQKCPHCGGELSVVAEIVGILR